MDEAKLPEPMTLQEMKALNLVKALIRNCTNFADAIRGMLNYALRERLRALFYRTDDRRYIQQSMAW